jgi:hypothetical protein
MSRKLPRASRRRASARIRNTPTRTGAEEMEYVPDTVIPECIHGGKVLIKKLDHPLWVNGIKVLAAEAVQGAQVACPAVYPVPRCNCVTSIIVGRSAKLSSKKSTTKYTPLLATAMGLTDGGTWSIPGGTSGLRVGGESVPAPAACPVSTEQSAPAVGATGKSKAKAAAGLKLVLRLKPGSAHHQVEKKISVHVIAVQDDKVFSAAHEARPALPTDGTPLELATELDPKKPVWITATTHPMNNGVWSVEPEGAPRPFVFVPKRIVAKLSPNPGNGRWKRSWKELATCAGNGIDAKTLARANGIDPDKADEFAGWVVVRSPVKCEPKAGKAEVVLEPLYPRLLDVLRADSALAAAVSVVRKRYPQKTLDRLRVAARCEEVDKTVGRKMAIWRFARIRLGRRGFRPLTRHRYILILDAHDRHRRSESVLEMARKARAAADTLTAEPKGTESFAQEFSRFHSATPRCLLWCTRGGSAGENPDIYSTAARRNEAKWVFDAALVQIRDAVRFLAELDQVGRFAREPILSPAEQDRWAEWFDRFADTVFAVKDATAPGTAGLPADRGSLWITSLAWDAWKSFLTDTKWLVGEQELIVKSATEFELLAGVRPAGHTSVLDRFVTRLRGSSIDVTARGGNTYRIGSTSFAWKTYDAIFVDVRTVGRWDKLNSDAVKLKTSKLGQRQAALVVAIGSLLLYWAFKRETEDTGKLPSPDSTVSSDVSEWLTLIGLLHKGLETGLYRYAESVAIRDIAGLEANAAAKLSRTKLILKGSKGAGYLLGGASIAVKLAGAYDDLKAGNLYKAEVAVFSALVSLGLLVVPKGVFVDILTSAGFGMLEHYFERSELENALAELIRKTEFGEEGQKNSSVRVPYILEPKDFEGVEDKYLEAVEPNPAEDLKAFHDFYVCAACRAQVLTIGGRPKLAAYPVAGLWLWPQPGRVDVRGDLAVSGMPGVPQRVQVHARHTGWDTKGNRILRVRVCVPVKGLKPRSAKPVREELLILQAFRTDVPRGPVVPTAFVGKTTDGDHVLYATVPPGYTELDLGTVALPNDRRLLVVIAPDDVDVNGHIGSTEKREIGFNVLIDDPKGGKRSVKGWTTDKPVTATVTTVNNKTVLKLS